MSRGGVTRPGLQEIAKRAKFFWEFAVSREELTDALATWYDYTKWVPGTRLADAAERAIVSLTR